MRVFRMEKKCMYGFFPTCKWRIDIIQVDMLYSHTFFEKKNANNEHTACSLYLSFKTVICKTLEFFASSDKYKKQQWLAQPANNDNKLRCDATMPNLESQKEFLKGLERINRINWESESSIYPSCVWNLWVILKNFSPRCSGWVSSVIQNYCESILVAFQNVFNYLLSKKITIILTSVFNHTLTMVLSHSVLFETIQVLQNADLRLQKVLILS